MRIQLLGTAAAEGIPAFYSKTRVSEHARLHKGRDIRSRTGAIVDGTLKIDLPPDTLMQINREGLNARDWAAIIFTHSDDDHLAVRELQYAMYPFSQKEFMPFPLYGNAVVAEIICNAYKNWPLEMLRTSSFQPFEVAGYKVTPIAANHIPDEDCHNLLIERDGRSLLYATDTGYWKGPTWEFMADKHLDLLVIECTEGVREISYEGHLNIERCIEMVDRLRSMGVLGSSSRVCTTHHSHNGDATYDEIVVAMEPHGIIAGYDGLELEV